MNLEIKMTSILFENLIRSKLIVPKIGIKFRHDSTLFTIFVVRNEDDNDEIDLSNFMGNA